MQITRDNLVSTLSPLVRQCRHIYIAYSGGTDSHVLLHLCASVEEFKPKLTAVYINHDLQAQADSWGEHCSKVCAQLHIPIITARVDAQAKSRESPEEAARNARYHYFRQLVQSQDVMLLAQHQDDQMETFLLQLMRGAGLPGLSAMPFNSRLGVGRMLRPLLGCSQAQILAYAEANHLSSIQDPSNLDTDIDRNFLRLQIIPLLKQRWPAAAKTVSRSADHCAQSQQMLDAYLGSELPQLLGESKQTLSIPRLKQYQPAEQRQLLRKWMQSHGVRMPSLTLVEEVLAQMLTAATDKHPVIKHDKVCIRRYQNDIYLLPERPEPDLTLRYDWPEAEKRLPLPGNGMLELTESKTGIASKYWRQGKIRVGYRQSGETIRISGRSGQHHLKKLMQEWRIPPWQRARTPLIFINDKLAAVPGYCISAEFEQVKTEVGVMFHWYPPQ